jgi:hypothetical protein
MNSELNKNLAVVLQSVRKTLSEQVGPDASPVPMEAPAPKRKPTKVIFDKSTGSPFEVIFSERGFAIEGTRMSFEDLETAISKNFNITLDGGKGLTLDAVKMQKILKYKDVY